MQTHDNLLSQMRRQLAQLVPDPEIILKAELITEINRLKHERNAVILGHNYMEPALYHFVADFRGDSLELCRKAQTTECDVIVFCGVRFMAETAKIINPSKTVLVPSLKAGCSLAASITAEDVRRLKAQYPGVPVVTYVNTYADVKAESDICCTSSNAAAVIRSCKSDAVIFLPDEYMAKNLARETGKRILFPEADKSGAKAFDAGDVKTLENTVIAWHGKCEVHEQFSVEDIKNVRKQFPDVVVLSHPECSPEVVEASDFSGSTSAMIDYVKHRKAPHYLLLTECAMGDNIIAENPDSHLLRLCSVRCPHMNQISLEQTLASLQKLQYAVELDPAVSAKAKRAIDRMLEIRPTASPSGNDILD